MKLCAIYSMLFFLMIGEGLAQNLMYSKSLESSFFSEARFENIEAVSKKGTSIINTSNKEVAFKIPIRSFIFDNGLMQEHFNENYMESDQYPYATFKGKIKENIDLTKVGTYKVTASGQLSIHGITKERTVEGVLEVKKEQILLTSSFIVPVADHDIDIPNDKLSNISQDIRVKIKAAYEPKN
jgi:hypothetical protein